MKTYPPPRGRLGTRLAARLAAVIALAMALALALAFASDRAQAQLQPPPAVHSPGIEPEGAGNDAPPGFVLVRKGSEWRYRNEGTDLGTAWRNPDFDDSRWPTGPAQLGYGDGDEATITRSEGAPHPLTAYFRHEFQVPADVEFSKLSLRLLRDDGAVVYLNGREILRDNLPAGDIAFVTAASEATAWENLFHPFVASAQALVTGRNVLAVEVHQVNAESSDSSFDLELIALFPEPPTEPATVSLFASNPKTSEPSPLALVAPGEFSVRRTGDLSHPLSVLLRYGGTAKAARDYLPLPQALVIPAGKAEATLAVAAMSDDENEGVETVVAEILLPPGLPRTGERPDLAAQLPWLFYRIDPDHARAEVRIQDADRPVETATLEIDQPGPGERIPAGTTIRVEAIAIDPDGYIGRVEFFDGARSIGVSEIVFVRAPDPGTPIHHAFAWAGAAPGEHQLSARAVLASGAEIESPTVPIVVEDRPPVATIVIQAPEADSVHPLGEPVEIKAVATDPLSYISRVEFYDGDERVGVSELEFLVAPDPGTPITHTLEWKDVSSGEHRLHARAVDSRGAIVESRTVRFRVGPEPARRVVLEIIAVDAVATEPGAQGDTDPATFQVRRVGGPRDVAVPVFYDLSGEAQNGQDFQGLSGRVDLPAGAEAVEIVVRPLADRKEEGTERVDIKLERPVCPAIVPEPPQCYELSDRASAVALIRDPDRRVNRPPVVGVVAPSSGSVFRDGETIRVKAEATDADGSIERLDLLDGERLLGSTKTSVLVLEWKDASPGLHHLTARALDDDGAEAHSRLVTLSVRERGESAFVRRTLPPAYVPRSSFTVLLRGQPPRGSAAWTIEDAAPEGWVVSDISEGGAFDAAHGTVKFGPFLDDRERQVSYRVAVPSGASGLQTFKGTSSLDGKTYPVAGDDTVEPAGEFHPADSMPQDRSLSADEVTAFAAAWKQGEGWGGADETVRQGFVSRAGFLWKSGETYRFEPDQGPPPECWVPAAAGGAALAAVGSAATGIGDREASPLWKPGRGERIELRIVPPPGTKAVTVEDRVPAGWQVAEISDGGRFDPASRRIRWGIFFGDEPRRLGFRATPPAAQAGMAWFEGRASFDGVEIEIGGVRRAGVGDADTLPRILGCVREPAHSVRLRVQAMAEQVVAVEGSSDLLHWTDLQEAVVENDELIVTDPSSGAAGQRFYRLRPMGR